MPLEPEAATPYDEAYGGPDGEDEGREPRRGRAVLLVLLGLVIGFVAAFIVIALGSGDASTAEDPELATLQDENALLQAELDERDTRIADLEAQLDAADSAAGEQDAELQAQRDALDERANQLDDRASQLDDREDALDRREDELAEREAEPSPEPQPDTDTGTEPDADPGEIMEDAEGIVDRILEGIRDLFDGDG